MCPVVCERPRCLLSSQWPDKGTLAAESLRERVMVTEVSASVVGTCSPLQCLRWARCLVLTGCTALRIDVAPPGLLDQAIVQHVQVVNDLHEHARVELGASDHLGMLDAPEGGAAGEAQGGEGSMLAMWRLPPDTKVGLLNRLLDDFVESTAVDVE